MNTKRKFLDNKRKGRSLQRQRALDVLFEADLKNLEKTEIENLLNQRQIISTAQKPIDTYGVSLVRTYLDWSEEVDSIIDAASPAWSLSRMSNVDRNLLRIGATELIYLEVDRPVIIKEITALARDFSNDKSVSFVMGVLNRIAEIRDLETSGKDDLDSFTTDLSVTESEITPAE